jgi:hypothetical protein
VSAQELSNLWRHQLRGFQSCEQFLSRSLGRILHYKSVGAAGFEPAISWSQARRISRLSYTPNYQCFHREKFGASAARPRARLQRRKEGESNPQGFTLAPLATECHRQLACPSSNRRRPHSGPYGREHRECPAGVEPTLPPWQSGRLPLHHGHIHRGRIVKDSEGTEWDSNPRFRVTKAESSPLDHQCKIRSKLRVGPEGLEPSPAWVRTRCAAANTSVPFVFIITIDPGGVEPPSRGYQPRVLPLNNESSYLQAFRSGRSDLNRRAPVPETGGLTWLSHTLKAHR